jgi:phosphomannomutase
MGDGSGLILGVSGLRGVVGESLDPGIAERFMGAFCGWLRSRGGAGRVVIGRDGRAGGGVIYEAAIRGLRGSGFDVEAIGVATTPTVGVMCARDGVVGGVVVTASHNPAQWNGLKCLVNDDDGRGGRAPSGSEAAEIIARYVGGEQGSVDDEGALVRLESTEVVERHVSVVIGALGAPKSDSIRGAGLGCALDSVNASGAEGAGVLLDRLGVRAEQLFGDGSGVFPHVPEPTKENLSGAGGLCDAVPGLKADVGFAQDPDADRLAIVDETGAYIGEEYTLVLCAMALMEARKAKGGGDVAPVFVVNLSTSRMIDDVAKHYGGEVVRTAVGEANVVEAMKRLKSEGRDVVLGGEGNGGVIWPEVTYVRDSLSGMGLVLSLMARTGKSVSELVSMVNAMGPTDEVREKGYTILKSKSGLSKKEDARPVVAHLAEVYGGDGAAQVDLQDGIRIDWDEKGVWAHVRASNTEPIMRVIVEAPSEAEARRTADEIGSAIGSVGA